jgi:hypothetical protein
MDSSFPFYPHVFLSMASADWGKDTEGKKPPPRSMLAMETLGLKA